MKIIVKQINTKIAWNDKSNFVNYGFIIVTEELLICIFAEIPANICRIHHIDIWVNAWYKKLLTFNQKLWFSFNSLKYIEL